ncbi:hypothetical protein GH714_025561 [Hevea brasiliensis]|uniref:Sugar phosphate transporter domain-containing protein n=1 Tax=Hevea brasiliensis TaxID=3981 RepID=A0A6A6MZK6_HEVBR|nr:hypothetical protein GH714_025561 [Hevea brasiliensis]
MPTKGKTNFTRTLSHALDLFCREILNFLVRKDARKILKRKDSDAGERGASRSWIPLPHMPQFYSLLNKLGSDGHFKSPFYSSCIPPSKSSHLSLFTLGFVMSLSTGLANVSLKYNSVGFYQMAKIAVTPSIVLLEFIWFRMRVSFSKVVALTVVSVGVAVATVTDLQFSLFGACVALAWIIPSAINKILWSTLQQRENWTALALMWKTTPITLVFLASLIPFLDPPGVFTYHWNTINTLLILGSAFLGFLLQWSGALALGATSAISHVVLGQFKTCVVLLGNFYLFGSNPGVTSICGAFTAIAGMSAYTYLNLCGMKSQAGKTSPHKTPAAKSRLSRENGDSHDGYGGESV